MSPADVHVPQSSPVEIVKATDNYPHLHGWHTHTRSSTACRAHEPQAHQPRATKSAEHRAQVPRSYTNMCSLPWWWSVFGSVIGLAEQHMRGPGKLFRKRQATAVRTVSTGGLLCRGYSRSPTGLRHRFRALPQNTTEIGYATSSANGLVACVLLTIGLPPAAAHSQRLPAPLRRGVIGPMRGIALATRTCENGQNFTVEKRLFARSNSAASMWAQSCASTAWSCGQSSACKALALQLVANP